MHNQVVGINIFLKQKKNAFLKQQTCFSLHKNILSIKIPMISHKKKKKNFSGYCRGEIEIVWKVGRWVIFEGNINNVLSVFFRSRQKRRSGKYFSQTRNENMFFVSKKNYVLALIFKSFFSSSFCKISKAWCDRNSTHMHRKV